MSSFTVITDSTADIPKAQAAELGLEVMPLSITFTDKGETYDIFNEQENIDINEFYRRLVDEKISTAQVNPFQFETVFERILQQGQDLIYTGLAGGLSKTFESSQKAKSTLEKKYPDRTIACVDSASVASGLHLAIMELVRLRDEGFTAADAAQFLEDNKLRITHLFSVDDYKYLHRGGRLSTFQTLAGTALGIVPILHVQDDGTLANLEKTRGLKKAMNRIVELICENIADKLYPTIYISHGAAPEKVDILRSQILEQIPGANIICGDSTRVGPIVGSHVGPGVVAIFFWSPHRI